ncbi:hypothetical protein CYMTET_45556 [Cymbomonas tetramitiformis]|uniref:Uncharacterized protein n=1 Tax=Cymbomonas tetramitiformis TaxID=36881 RepID=A0AAE0EXY1_9CHLO|nr:hypothetical protein CYMTET_45556 [Cymbomonas tetramitiformis]
MEMEMEKPPAVVAAVMQIIIFFEGVVQSPYQFDAILISRTPFRVCQYYYSGVQNETILDCTTLRPPVRKPRGQHCTRCTQMTPDETSSLPFHGPPLPHDQAHPPRSVSEDRALLSRRSAMTALLTGSSVAAWDTAGPALRPADALTYDATTWCRRYSALRDDSPPAWCNVGEEEAATVAAARRYSKWWGLPLAPFENKATTRTELVEGSVWGFEQLFGILDVLVNARMTVVKLEGGGLWVHNTLAPTEELKRLLGELEAAHGPVKYLVVGSAAVEHKWCTAAMAEAYPEAEVWVPPNGWSWPVNGGPLGFSPVGLYPSRVAGVLPISSEGWNPPWGDQIEHEVLGVGGSVLTGFNRPWFTDCGFYDRRSRTLLVTDVVQSAHSQEPPAVAVVDPYPLLLRAQSGPGDIRPDTPANRREGWGKTLLFGLLFKPEAVDSELFRREFNLRRGLRDAYIWDKELYEATLATITDPILFVPPIAEVLGVPRRPTEIDAWARKVAKWDFKQIVPGHLDAPIAAGPYEFLATVSSAINSAPLGPFNPKDLFVVRTLEQYSVAAKTLQPSRLEHYDRGQLDAALDGFKR